jgi:acetylornithine/succinyldiaminopimelate/putrescine aminotransferase
MTLAKPLAGGLPIGAILMTDRVASTMEYGGHGSTFAGGPLICAVALHVFDRISAPSFLAHVRETGEYLKERLEEINSAHIKEIRGRGLMVGIELDVEVGGVVSKGQEHGVLLVGSGQHVLRLVPPLVVNKSHVDTFIEKFTQILAGY